MGTPAKTSMTIKTEPIVARLQDNKTPSKVISTTSGSIPRAPGSSNFVSQVPQSKPASATAVGGACASQSVSHTMLCVPNHRVEIVKRSLQANAEASDGSAQVAGGSSNQSVALSVSGTGANDTSGSKRLEESEQMGNSRPLKVQCSRDFSSIFDSAKQNLAGILEEERRQFLDQQQFAQAKFHDEIKKLRAQHADEIKRIKEEHATAIEAQALSFTQQLNQRKVAEQEERSKFLAEKEKEFNVKIEVANAKLNSANSAFKTSLMALRNEMEDQERKRVQGLTNQYDAERKAALAEARVESQATEASLRAMLAERDLQISSFKKVIDSIENIKGISEAMTTLPDQVSKIQHLNTTFVSSVETFQKEFQHLQGFLSAFQASAASSRAMAMPSFYWHAGPGPMHGGPQHRGVNPGFHPQSGQ